MLRKILGETCLSRPHGNEVIMLFAMITSYGCYGSVLPKCPDRAYKCHFHNVTIVVRFIFRVVHIYIIRKGPVSIL